MFKHKISIVLNSDFNKEKLFDEFIILLGDLGKTGQITGGIESPYSTGNEIISFQTTLERDSLDKKYNDKWVNLKIKNLEDWCRSELQTELIGDHIPFYKEVCNCKHHNYYILFTTYLNESSSVKCGTCNQVIPIYKLKGLTDEDRTLLGNWEGDYVSCDSLNMGCLVGEKWATKQLSDPGSQLSKLGMKVCNRIKQTTGISTYYYLYNYRSISAKKDKLRKCPICSSDWLLKDQLHGFYDFKCNNCSLISTLTRKS